jgi:YVTN family beta-propeller protein
MMHFSKFKPFTLMLAMCLMALPFQSEATSRRSQGSRTAQALALVPAPMPAPAPAPVQAPVAETIPGLPSDVTQYMLAHHADATTRGRVAQTHRAGRDDVNETRTIFGSRMKDARLPLSMIKRIGTTSIPGEIIDGFISKNHKTLFVLDFQKNQVHEVDLATFHIQNTISLEHSLLRGAQSEDGRELFVAGFDALSIIDLENRQVTHTLKLPHTIEFMVPAHGHLYAFHSDNMAFSDVNLQTYKVDHTSVIGGRPLSSAIASRDGQTLYIHAGIPEDQIIIASVHGHVMHAIQVGRNSLDMVLEPDGNRLIVSEAFPDSLGVIDLLQNPPGVQNIKRAGFVAPKKSIFNKQGDKLYVLTMQNTVAIFDPTNFDMLRQVKVGTDPVDCAFIAHEKYLAVVNKESGDVSLLDTSTDQVVKTIRVAKSPIRIIAEEGAPVCILSKNRMTYIQDDKYL